MSAVRRRVLGHRSSGGGCVSPVRCSDELEAVRLPHSGWTGGNRDGRSRCVDPASQRDERPCRHRVFRHGRAPCPTSAAIKSGRANLSCRLGRARGPDRARQCDLQRRQLTTEHRAASPSCVLPRHLGDERVAAEERSLSHWPGHPEQACAGTHTWLVAPTVRAWDRARGSSPGRHGLVDHPRGSAVDSGLLGGARVGLAQPTMTEASAR